MKISEAIAVRDRLVRSARHGLTLAQAERLNRIEDVLTGAARRRAQQESAEWEAIGSNIRKGVI